jgi:hypothetical protein
MVIANVADKTIRRWIGQGRLEAIMLKGSHGVEYRMTMQALQAAISNQPSKAKPPAVSVPGIDIALFAQFMNQAMADANAAVMDKLVEIEERIDELRQSLDQPRAIEAPAELHQLHLELQQIRLKIEEPPNERVPWWRRLLRRT